MPTSPLQKEVDRYKGFEPPFYSGDNWIKIKITPNGVILHLLLDLAGGESLSWHPLLEDFISLARKLERLGFIYSKGEVVIIDELVELGDQK